MPVPYQHPRGTRANLTTLAVANGLVVGQIYFITDEQRLAVATAANAFTTLAKESEVGGGGGSSELDYGKTLAVSRGFHMN